MSLKRLLLHLPCLLSIYEKIESIWLKSIIWLIDVISDFPLIIFKLVLVLMEVTFNFKIVWLASLEVHVSLVFFC